ncbi:SAF domain-containing protein [Cellulomonas sp. PhB143]|uniref:SAF domain-containing protein n=1 Tax=Cellulomonas sp. PhB143 TaxID=2485186 RepID=UPI000F460C52|nr:SAF domain-containing protein [Cellulomonas sp. PhB143]ROS78725.1 Flp pilus assembly protein CpaB [Cellulomonas sp. PhB143]
MTSTPWLSRPDPPHAGAPVPRSTWRRRSRAALHRSRFLVAAAAAGLATAIVVHALAPPPPRTAPVAVARHEIAAGAAVGPDDVRVARYPLALVPAGAVDAAEALADARAAVPIGEGEPLLPSVTTSGGAAASGPPGTVVVPVRLADPEVAAVLAPGDRVDLVDVAPDDGEGSEGTAPGDSTEHTKETEDADDAEPPSDPTRPQTLTQGAVVVPGGAEPPGDDGVLGTGAASAPTLVLLAVSAEDAPGVARAASASRIAAILVP